MVPAFPKASDGLHLPLPLREQFNEQIHTRDDAQRALTLARDLNNLSMQSQEYARFAAASKAAYELLCDHERGLTRFAGYGGATDGGLFAEAHSIKMTELGSNRELRR